MIGIRLLNGEVRHTANPRSFHIPTRAEREGVAVGGFVKCMFHDGTFTERMWVKVTRRNDDGSYTGELNNDPAQITAIKCGDPVTLSPEHIIDILEK